MLACAGLERLGLASQISETFSLNQMLPAAAQGVIGIECLEHRPELLQTLKLLNHPATKTILEVEDIGHLAELVEQFTSDYVKAKKILDVE